MTFGLKLALACWALGVVVVFLVWRYAARMVVRIAAAESWPRTRAVITRSEVLPAGKGAFRPAVLYRYQVAGRDYDGHRLYFGNRTGNHAFAEEALKAWPVGLETTVCYDPDRPDFSVLSPTGDPKAYFQGAGLLAALFAFTGVVLMFVD